MTNILQWKRTAIPNGYFATNCQTTAN